MQLRRMAYDKNSGRLRYANRPYKLDQTNHRRVE
jgi:hypothetical protein